MTIVPSIPFNLTNGTLADATQVMGNFNTIVSDVNTNAAHNGANSDITSLTGLTTPLPAGEGGTGNNSAGSAGQVLTSDGTKFAPQNLPPAVITGSILMWPANTAPTGYLECDGSAISRTTFAALFAITGTVFGTGDGSTTFNIPDMRGYFPRGWAHGGSVDSGRTFGSTQAAAFASHTHAATVTDPKHSHAEQGGVGGGGFDTIAIVNGGSGSSGPLSSGLVTAAAATGITVSNASTGGAETRPINLALMFIIKT